MRSQAARDAETIAIGRALMLFVLVLAAGIGVAALLQWAGADLPPSSEWMPVLLAVLAGAGYLLRRRR